MDGRGARPERGDRVGDGLSDFVLNRDLLRCPPRGLWMVGGDKRDRLALVAHDILGEHGLVGMFQTAAVRAGDVGVRQDRVDACRGERSPMPIDLMRADGCGLRSVTPQIMSSVHRSLP